MAKSGTHFQWSHLKPMVEENGWSNSVQEVERIEREMKRLNDERNKLLASLLDDVVFNHVTGAKKCKFKPCHARRIHSLTVHTEFWLL